MDKSLVINSYEIVKVIGDKELFGEEMKSCSDKYPYSYNYFVTILTYITS